MIYPRVVFSGLLLVSLTACFGPRVHDVAPSNYTIAGVWELNKALSGDNDQALASIEPRQRGPRSGKGGPGAPGGPGDAPAPEVINDPTTDLPPIDPRGYNRNMYGGYNDRNQYRPPIDFQTNALMGGEWLKIQQTDSEVRIGNAATNRSFTPGERSVVSVPSGVADQVTGWSGRSYLIYQSPQIGPKVTERYSLTPDGQHLQVRIEVSGEGRNRAMKVTRTYDRSTKDPASLQQTYQVTLPPTY